MTGGASAAPVRAIEFSSLGTVAIVDLPPSAPARDEVLLRTEFLGICVRICMFCTAVTHGCGRR